MILRRQLVYSKSTVQLPAFILFYRHHNILLFSVIIMKLMLDLYLIHFKMQEKYFMKNYNVQLCTLVQLSVLTE